MSLDKYSLICFLLIFPIFVCRSFKKTKDEEVNEQIKIAKNRLKRIRKQDNKLEKSKTFKFIVVVKTTYGIDYCFTTIAKNRAEAIDKAREYYIKKINEESYIDYISSAVCERIKR